MLNYMLKWNSTLSAIPLINNIIPINFYIDSYTVKQNKYT